MWERAGRKDAGASCGGPACHEIVTVLSTGNHNVFFFSLKSIAMRVEKRTMTSNYFSNRTFYYLLRIFSRNKVHNMTTKSKAC